MKELLEFAREAGCRRSNRFSALPPRSSPRSRRYPRSCRPVAGSPRRVLPRRRRVARNCSQPALIKRRQRQLAPLEPAAEIGQHVTLRTDRALRIPLAQEFRRKALDVGGQWPSAGRPSGAVAAPWQVSVIVRLLQGPGRSPSGDDSRIMPRNQAPLRAHSRATTPVADDHRRLHSE